MRIATTPTQALAHKASAKALSVAPGANLSMLAWQFLCCIPACRCHCSDLCMWRQPCVILQQPSGVCGCACAGTEEREHQGADGQPCADQHPHDMGQARFGVHSREDDPGLALHRMLLGPLAHCFHQVSMQSLHVKCMHHYGMYIYTTRSASPQPDGHRAYASSSRHTHCQSLNMHVI